MLHGRGQCRGGELTHGSAHVSLPRAVRARALYLHVVCLTCTRTAQVVSEATVEPVGSDDWEVVELHAGEIEDQLLNQVPPFDSHLQTPKIFRLGFHQDH